jgi:hypothetical protein
MDDLFCYPAPSLVDASAHGGANPVIKAKRHRVRTASSFRAAWEPAASPEFGALREPHRLTAAAGASAATARAIAIAPPVPGIIIGEIAQPVTDAAIAVRERATATPWRRLGTRALEILPFALAFALITSLVWGSIWLPVPLVIMLLGFDFYWAWRSINNGVHAVRGYRAMKAAARIDWKQKYRAETFGPPAVREGTLAWEDVYHLVIIPTYKESLEKLRATLGKLAETDVASEKLLVVIATEAADADAPARYEQLEAEFARSFLAMACTVHPSDIAGEVRGKSSNEAWAAKHAKRLFCDQMGYDLDAMTVTSCDADTLFHPRYFSALTYEFAMDRRRYRRFWQGPIFYYNNVWDVPAPLRIGNSLGGINHLAKLMRKHTVLFPQSTYSLSMRMCHDVGYWDVDVVPEDWHMFLKCFFALDGEPDVKPILLPVGNDGVRAHSYMGTFWEHYQQARRHAWGCSDIPYTIKQFVRNPQIPFLRRLRRTWSITENHVLWSSQWFLITGVAANMSAASWGGFLSLKPFAQHNIPDWFVTASHWILMPCMIPLIVMIILDTIMRPARPKHWKWWLFPVQFAQWMLMAPITLFFTALPALDAQIRLAMGRRLEYKVTEKA